MTKTVTLKQAMSRVDSLKAEVRRIYADALRDKLPFRAILDRTADGVYARRDGLHRWAYAEIAGYVDAHREWHERLYTRDRWELDGRLYVEGPGRDAAFEGRWHLVRYAGRWYVDEGGVAAIYHHSRGDGA